MSRVLFFTALVAATCWASWAAKADEDRPKNPYGTWTHGLPTDGDFFPVAVWLQSPANAAKYKAAGVNLYVGLWRGPTEEQRAGLKRNGMRVICSQNAVGLKHPDDPTIVGWMHGDEPDNAQSLGKGKGYGPPVPPADVAADYAEYVKGCDIASFDIYPACHDNGVSLVAGCGDGAGQAASRKQY